VTDFAEVLVIGNASEEFKTVIDRIRPGQIIVDLVRISERRSEPGQYDGICW